MSHERVKFFASYIESQLGIVYSEANFFQLENRLDEVARAVGLDGLEALWQRAREGIVGEMKQRLLDAATNNETSFFRDSQVFRAIETLVVPERANGKQAGTPLRIWCAASSTGQEPYTVAIVLAELAKKMPLPRIEILATDISERVLARARDGTYSQLEVQRGMSAGLLIRYFSRLEEKDRSTSIQEWQLKSEIRNAVTYQRLNLLDDWGAMGEFDLIMCRNVLIYQSVENKKKILNKLTARLSKNGFLMLGAAESLLGLHDGYTQVESCGAIFYRKKDDVPVAVARIA